MVEVADRAVRLARLLCLLGMAWMVAAGMLGARTGVWWPLVVGGLTVAGGIVVALVVSLHEVERQEGRPDDCTGGGHCLFCCNCVACTRDRRRVVSA